MHAFEVVGKFEPRYLAEHDPWSEHRAAAHRSTSVSVKPDLILHVAEPQSQNEVSPQELLQSSGHSADINLPSLVKLQSTFGKSPGLSAAHAPVLPHASFDMNWSPLHMKRRS